MADPDFKDYYKILGVNRGASRDEIRSAFREKAKELHPDKNIGQPEGVIKQREKRMKDAADAWGILSRENSRNKYDRLHQEYEATRSRSRTSEGAHRPQSRTTPRQTDSYEFERDWADFQRYWEDMSEKINKETAQQSQKIDEELKKSRQETEDWLKQTSRETEDWLKKTNLKIEEDMEKIRQTNKPGVEQETSLKRKLKWGPVEETNNPSEQTIRFGKSYKPHDIKWVPVDEGTSGESKG